MYNMYIYIYTCVYIYLYILYTSHYIPMIFPTYRVSRLRHSSMVSSPGVPPHRPTPSFSSSATSVMLRGHDAMESAGIC